MPETTSPDQIKRIAGLELNALRLAEVLPAEIFEGAHILSAGTPIYDINGELLYHRVPLTRGRARVAYADIAVHPQLGAPLLATAHGIDWNEKAIRKDAIEAAHKRAPNLAFDVIRFVAYSYPKLALQFLKAGEETLMLEWGTWEVVEPAKPNDRKPLEPENFERWSLLGELPDERKKAAARAYGKRISDFNAPKFRRRDVTTISKDVLEPVIKVKSTDTHDLHYSKHQADHHVCYELRGQETNVWCVGASTEMLLDFYRYEYTQVRLAQELGLGTLANPNGLSYSHVGDVVTVIEDLTSHALNATMITNPGFATFQNEIKADRPLISFIPGHSRTVTGYTHDLFSLPGSIGFRGLLVYDPWPPNLGVITQWENFDANTYQYAYSATVTLV
jgi:Peptidase_C39 like family